MKVVSNGKQHLPKPASTPSEFAQNCHSIAPAATAFCASFDLNTLFDSRTIVTTTSNFTPPIEKDHG